MKTTIALTALATLFLQISAKCFSTELGYPCCSSSSVAVKYTDKDGKWGFENGKWCGIPSKAITLSAATKKCNGYPCCSSSKAPVKKVLKNGTKLGKEKGKWCGIPKSNSGSSKKSTKKSTSKKSNNAKKVKKSSQLTIKGNPFKGVDFYINPYYVNEVNQALKKITNPTLKKKAKKMRNYSNAIWLDTIKNMNSWLKSNLKGALAQQNKTGRKVLTVFVVYDLPGRDCHALASNGELMANNSDFNRYKKEYIDVIAKHLKTYNSQPVVLIIEPDSLANMVTNLESTPACRKSEKYYLNGHAYLIKKLGVLPHVAMYLDIGHAFWLGWDDNRQKAGTVYSKVIKSGSPGKIRGFTDNVSNYTPWEDPSLSRGPETEWNPCPDEKRYLQAMYKDFKAAGIKSVYFVSDTSRNGRKTQRKDNGEWCNQKGAAVGARPKANPVKGMPYLDAFYWIKPVGESDGTSNKNAKRYDGYCGHSSAMKNAPEAGKWFQKFFEEAVKNANPKL